MVSPWVCHHHGNTIVPQDNVRVSSKQKCHETEVPTPFMGSVESSIVHLLISHSFVILANSCLTVCTRHKARLDLDLTIRALEVRYGHDYHIHDRHSLGYRYLYPLTIWWNCTHLDVVIVACWRMGWFCIPSPVVFGQGCRAETIYCSFLLFVSLWNSRKFRHNYWLLNHVYNYLSAGRCVKIGDSCGLTSNNYTSHLGAMTQNPSRVYTEHVKHSDQQRYPISLLCHKRESHHSETPSPSVNWTAKLR